MQRVGLVLVVISALVAGIEWGLRARAHKPPAEAGAPVAKAPAAPVDPARPTFTPPVAPRHPVDPSMLQPVPVPAEGVPAPAADSLPFEREVRDASWAVDQERELKLRLDRVVGDLAARGSKVTITSAECRRTLCRVEIAAPAAADLSALYGAIETPEGLYGWADTIVLGQVDGDLTQGTLSTSILVSFERS